MSFDFAAMSAEQRKKTIAENSLSITPEEALKIQDMVKRPPTLSECILWGIQGSEHCSYKSSRIHLKTLTTDGPNVILGAKEDAGVVHVATDNNGEQYGVVISHESHNHPSQVVPFEGAATGIGGNVRDVCCMGATVIANADSLRFGSLDQAKTHWIYEGVVEGIASYGNALGVPNIAGDVQFDADYNDNCLVTAVTLGVVKVKDITHSYAPKNADGYDLILVGKPTDNSGFGGASFASIDLEEENKEANRGAVQEPNAFLGRMMLKSNYALFDKLAAQGLSDKIGFKDLGAGGIACASVELAEAGGYGAQVCIDDVHTSMDDLNPAVLLCSETQERYMWVCRPELTPMVLAHYNEEYDLPGVSEGARATVVGKVKAGGRYTVTYRGETLIDAQAKDITEGIVYDRPAQKSARQLSEPTLPQHNVIETWQRLLAHENVACQSGIYETYDKQVQGRTVIERGLSDAGVLAPFNGPEFPADIQQTGVALAVADNPRFGKIDPYWGAVNAVVQAMGHVAAVGATPEAITDCLCFGNPEKPEQMADFVDAIKGIKTACETIHLKNHPGHATPIVAGNVSLYNESKNGAIPASPMISCLGRLADVSIAIDATFKQPGEVIALIGARQDDCGGSVYYQLFGELGANVPKPELTGFHQQVNFLTDGIDQGLFSAAKWIGCGGVGAALAQMSFAKGMGFEVATDGALDEARWLFTETPGWIVTLPEDRWQTLHALAAEQGVEVQRIGHTQAEAIGQVNQHRLDLIEAKTLWQQGLRKHFT